MSNVTPTLSPRAPDTVPGSPLRGTLKGALATLVLLLLGLLFWQLLDQLRVTQQQQRQYTIDYTAERERNVFQDFPLRRNNFAQPMHGEDVLSHGEPSVCDR